jgi:hypothetical protein
MLKYRSAVAVWQHRPTADELLQYRLANGWTPTPSEMVDGMRVLGHASCALPQSVELESR